VATLRTFLAPDVWISAVGDAQISPTTAAGIRNAPRTLWESMPTEGEPALNRPPTPGRCHGDALGTLGKLAFQSEGFPWEVRALFALESLILFPAAAWSPAEPQARPRRRRGRPAVTLNAGVRTITSGNEQFGNCRREGGGRLAGSRKFGVGRSWKEKNAFRSSCSASTRRCRRQERRVRVHVDTFASR